MPQRRAAQAKIMLHRRASDQHARQRVHFLGFGFTTAYGKIDKAMRTSSTRFAPALHLFCAPDAIPGRDCSTKSFFFYLEDADLSWKLRQIGIRSTSSVIQSLAQIASSTLSFYYFLERTLGFFWVTYYKTPTLVRLLPAIIAMEIGQFIWRRQESPRPKIRALQYFLDRKKSRPPDQQRQKGQRRRLISDVNLHPPSPRNLFPANSQPNPQDDRQSNPLRLLAHRPRLIWWCIAYNVLNAYNRLAMRRRPICCSTRIIPCGWHPWGRRRLNCPPENKPIFLPSDTALLLVPCLERQCFEVESIAAEMNKRL